MATSSASIRVEEDEEDEEIFRSLQSVTFDSINILVTGKTGAGKSSLVNAVIGSSTDGAQEGKDLGGTTKAVTGYSATIGGVPFKIWDAPGLQDAKHDDEEILDIIRKSLSESDISSVHLVLYCIRMDQDRIDRAELNGINLLCQLFNKEIWNHAVFALTFANRVLPPPEKDDDDDTAEQWFEDRIKEFENRIHETLVDSGVSKDIAKNVKALPTGYHKRTRRIPEPKKIIGKQDWLSPFWCSCAEHLKEEALVSLFISQTPRINTTQDLVEVTSPKEENDPLPLNISEQHTLWQKIKNKTYRVWMWLISRIFHRNDT